ncbi:hypothetical protein WJX74_004668 [Apatococcus lobatus]|uniref:Sfi1 spindle body domain-containing protein n=1 Tax=Apatococcus lobatus TaxID=904363 RepID=A0AAW1RZM9_9CHLO
MRKCFHLSSRLSNFPSLLEKPRSENKAALRFPWIRLKPADRGTELAALREASEVVVTRLRRLNFRLHLRSLDSRVDSSHTTFHAVLTGSPKVPGLPVVEPAPGPNASGTASPTLSLGSASIEYYADAADQPLIAASPQRHPAVPALDLPLAQQQSGHDLAAAALLSRQSSPGKPGAPSLSTRSGASSLMSWNPGGQSKSYAAGPRSFSQSSMKHAGLETGDVVAFSSKDAAYVVCQEEDAGVVCFIFKPAETETSGHAAPLEVVRQGNWVGFRSAAAEDKFLQVKRKGMHRLAFHNAQFGTWEQWEIVQGQAHLPWEKLSLGFRNRRLPQFVLSVEVSRLGTYAMLPNSFLTPRSLIPYNEGPKEDEEIEKISSVMIKEWFHFVEQEKQKRQQLALEVDQLTQESTEIREWAFEQIESIREEMHLEIHGLVEIIEEQADALHDLEDRLANRLRWGISVLHAKNAAAMRVQVLVWWRRVAAWRRHCAVAVVRLREQHARAQMVQTLKSWQQVASQGADRRAQMRKAVKRMGLSHQRACFHGWRARVDLKQEAAVLAEELVGHAKRLRARRRLIFTLRSWAILAQEQAAARAQAQSLANRHACFRLQASFLGWQQHVELLQARRQRAQSMQLHAMQSFSRQMLHEWSLETAHQRGLRHAVDKGLHAQKCRLQGQAFASWTIHVDEQREERQHLRNVVGEWRDQAAIQHAAADAAEVKAHALEQSMLQASLKGWHNVTTQRRRERLLTQRSRARGMNHRLKTTLQGWLEYSLDQRARHMQLARAGAKAQRSMLQHSFTALRGAVLQAEEMADASEGFIQESQGKLMSKILLVWQSITSEKFNQKVQLQMLSSKLSVCKLAAAWGAWTAHAEKQRTDKAIAAVCQRRAKQRMLRSILQVWHAAVALRQESGRILSVSTAKRTGRQLSSCFQSWRHHLAETHAFRGQLEQMGHACDISLQGLVLKSWQDHKTVCQHHKMILFQSLVKRAQKLAGSAFSAWRAYTHSQMGRRDQLCLCVGRIAAVRQRAVLLAWFAAASKRALLHRKLGSFVWRRSQMLMAACLDVWSRQAKRTARLNLQAAYIASGWHRAASKNVFEAWQAVTCMAKVQRRAIARMKARRQQQAQVMILAHWRLVTSEKRSAITAAETLSKSHQKNLLVSAWSSWQHAQDQQVLARSAACQVLASMQRRGEQAQMRACLNAWQGLAQHLLWSRQHLTTKVLRLSNKTALSATFSGWCEEAATEKRLHALEASLRQRHRSCTLGRLLQAWLAITQEHKLAARKLELVAARRQVQRVPFCSQLVTSLPQALTTYAFGAWQQRVKVMVAQKHQLQKFVKRWGAQVLSRGLVAWMSAVNQLKQQRQAVADCQERHRLLCLQSAFDKWSEVWQERVAATERLRMCIAAKRISFRLFKQIYWQSFDEDIQVILRQVFEATEEALATPQRSPRPMHAAPYPALPMLPYPGILSGSTSGQAHADALMEVGSKTSSQQQQQSLAASVPMPMSPTRMEHLSRRSLAAGLRAQYGMRTTPKSLRPREANRLHGSPAQTSSQLSQAILTLTPSPLSLSLVDAWDASMMHQQGSSQNSSPTALLMGPSPEQPSSAATSPDKSSSSQDLRRIVNTAHPLSSATSPDRSYTSNGIGAGLDATHEAEWDDADDEVVMGEDEPCVASDKGSSMRFDSQQETCHHIPAQGSAADSYSATSSPVRQSQNHSSAEGRSDSSPPIVLTSSPMRPSPLPQNASGPLSSRSTPSNPSVGLNNRMSVTHAAGVLPLQPADVGHPHQGAWTEQENVSTIDRSFVISEGPQQLAGSTSIVPREGTLGFPQAASHSAGSSGSWKFSTHLHQEHAFSTQLSSSKRPAGLNMPSPAPQEDLPQGSPLSRSSSGPLAGRAAIPGSTSTSSPSDLSSPEPGIIHTTDDSPLPCQAGDPSSTDTKGREAFNAAAIEATSRPPAALEPSADDAVDDDDQFGEFSIGAVHTSPHKGSPAGADQVVWRSGITVLNSASKGHSTQPSSSIVSPLAQRPHPHTSLSAVRSQTGSPSKTPITSAASDCKTPWTIFQTPHLGSKDAGTVSLSGSKADLSEGSSGGNLAWPEASMYATPAATGMGSVNKTAGSQTPKARRFETGLEVKQQGGQWRDLFDGYDSELNSPDIGRRGLDSPVTPRTRSVLDSPVQQLDLAAANARGGPENSWAGFNPFFSQS